MPNNATRVLDEKGTAAHFSLLLLSSLDLAVKSYENTEVLRSWRGIE